MIYRGLKKLSGTGIVAVVALAGIAAAMAGAYVTDEIGSIQSRAPHQYTEKKEKVCLKSMLIAYGGRQAANAGNKDLTRSIHEEYLTRIQEECGDLSPANFEYEAFTAIGEVYAKLVQLYEGENTSSLDLDTQVRSIAFTLMPLANQYTVSIAKLERTPEFKKFVSEIPLQIDELRVEYARSLLKNSAIIFPFSLLLFLVGYGYVSRKGTLNHPYIS